MRHGRWAAATTALVMAVSLACYSATASSAQAAVKPARMTGKPAQAAGKPARTVSKAARTARESASDRMARRLGLQVVPKRPTVKRRTAAGAAPANPYTGLVRDPARTDMSYWRAQLKAKSKARAKAASRMRKAAGEPLLVDEQEPDQIRGGNDSAANAQVIPQFGSGRSKRPAARIMGTLADPAAPDDVAPAPEDNGSISLAGGTGLMKGDAVTTTGTIGDGPHGSTGDATGDFDYYKISGVTAGERVTVDIDTPNGQDGLDSVVILWNKAGKPVAVNDDGPTGIDSYLSTIVAAAGTYYVSVQAYDSLPGDPFDSGSGSGVTSEGPYTITLGLNADDIDYYAVDLNAGDVLSGSLSGGGSTLSVRDGTGAEVMGSSQDASGIYPADTPLLGGGNAVVDHVAQKTGRYYVVVWPGLGDYSVTLEVDRPGLERAKAEQTIFLDFDGARLNTNIFGGPGVRTLSPLSAFLGRWGIPAGQENALINRVVSTVSENLKYDFAGSGVTVKVLNSRDNADPWGQPNVSRLIVGGTVDESGIDTIGISQSIDPGNFDTTESALILLDYISGPKSDDASFNHYLKPSSNKVRFVGTALGNIVSHEAGHFFGSWHVDETDSTANLMDAGGNFGMLYGVGADGIGGTADDVDVDFGPDTFNLDEGFTGTENTRYRTIWGLRGLNPYS